MFTRRDCVRYVGLGGAALVATPKLALAAPTPRILVRAGPFPMGTSEGEAVALAAAHGYHPSWLEGELPRRIVHLPTYAIEKYPVTNQQYAVFCAATGHLPPYAWGGPTPPAAWLDHPVAYVEHADAEAYAAWRGMRLPTEAEWEKAARGPNGFTFPWGNVFDPTACHWNVDPTAPGPGTAPVGLHPAGASPYGVEDMAGNVGEWCADPLGPSTAVVKGGCWAMTQVLNLRSASRGMSCQTNIRDRFHGFRCAKDVT